MNTKHWQAAVAVALAVLTGVQAAEQTATLKADRVNVRGEATLNSEVITQLRQGEKVTVLEEITVEKPKPGEPAKWARILLPSNTPVWISTLFIDPETKTVKVNRLNVRSGPGENFSVLCRLEKGAAVKEIRTVGSWMEIEPPATTSAYVSAEFLEPAGAPAAPAKPENMVLAESKPAPKPAEPVVTDLKPAEVEKPVMKETKPIEPIKAPEPISTVETVKVEPPPAPVMDTVSGSTSVKPAAKLAPMKAPEVEVPSSVVKAPIVIAPPPPVEPPPAPVAKSESIAAPVIPAPDKTASKKPAPALPAALVTPPAITPAPAEPAAVATPEPPPRRIVSREGIVKRAWSIQSPTPFELADPQTGKRINYLYTEDTGLQLKYYLGKRILISGEEKVDPRWPAMPLITIKTLEALK